MELVIVQGDVTEQRVDALVNAANSSLLGGGGVDGAIHRKGGPAILAACRELRRTTYPDGLPVGAAVATTAGELPARWVIHTVGPIHGRGTVDQLASCYTSALSLAASLGATSIAFPLISAGAYRWPREQAMTTAIQTIRGFDGPGTATLVIFGGRDHRRALQLANR